MMKKNVLLLYPIIQRDLKTIIINFYYMYIFCLNLLLKIKLFFFNLNVILYNINIESLIKKINIESKI
jgi:hypothetical protein